MEQEAKQFIVEDLKRRFNLSEEKITINELHPSDFPPDAKLYRADKRGGHGNIYYNYIYTAGQYFCSSDEKSFQHLLAAQKLLTQPHWNAHQFAMIFLNLVVRDLQLVENREQLHLSADDELNSLADLITPPMLEVTTEEAHAKFWTYQLRYRKLEVWQITVTSSYQVSYTRSNRPQ